MKIVKILRMALIMLGATQWINGMEMETDTELLPQDIPFCIARVKAEAITRISNFIDEIAPGEDTRPFLEANVQIYPSHEYPQDHTKGSFKLAINQMIDSAPCNVTLPVDLSQELIWRGEINRQLISEISRFTHATGYMVQPDSQFLDDSVTIGNMDEQRRYKLFGYSPFDRSVSQFAGGLRGCIE